MMQTRAFGKKLSQLTRALLLAATGFTLAVGAPSAAWAAIKKPAPAAKKADKSRAKPATPLARATKPAARAGQAGQKEKAAKVSSTKAVKGAQAGKASKAMAATAAARSARGGAPAARAAQRVAQGKAATRMARPRETVTVTKMVRGKGGRMIVAKVREARPARVAPAARVAAAPRLSFGQMAGLRAVNDPLDLASSVALVMDQDTNEILFSKNDRAVLPIASITKLMTGLLVSEAGLPLDELITITQDDVDTEKGSRSRLAVGTTLTRGELLHLALMSSENRAAHALGRTYPGGLARFVPLMNARALMLGMKDTRYVEPTGLSSANRSSATDLATLVAVAHNNPLVRQLSTSPGHEIAVGERVLQYHNTNQLVHNPEWDIGLQKTGYISEAGRCLVMQARVAGRKLIMVFLDADSKTGRLGDAERVRRWVEAERATNTLAAVRQQNTF